MAIAVAIILSIAVFAAPWPIGGNWAFCRTALLLASILASFGVVLWSVTQWKPQNKHISIIWLLLLLGIGFIYFQSSDWSTSLQSQFGKHNPPINITKLDKLDAPLDVENLPKRSISVYPAATREKLVDLILGIGLFFASSILLVERKTIYPVLIALVAVGVAISFFGVIQNLSWNGKLFWSYELLSGGGPFGSFVNKNNGAGFLLITFSASLFFIAHPLFIWNRQTQPEGLVLTSVDWEAERNEKKSLIERFTSTIALLEPKHLYVGAAVTTIFAGVFASLSRGGMVALVGATMVAFFVLAKINRFMVTLLTLALVAVVVLFVIYSDQDVGISDSLESLTDIGHAAAPRFAHWQDAWPFAVDNAILGCGSGTYRYVSPSFQSFYFTRTYAHAESIYLETFVEMGIGGVLLLLIVVSYCFVLSFQLLKRRESFDRALGVTGLTCLVGQMISSAFDFGLYQPANTTAMAVLMGVIVGRASRIENARTNKVSSTGVRFALTLGMGAIIFCSVWAIYNSYGIESRKRATRSIALLNRYKAKDVPMARLELDKIESQLNRAVKIVPDDFKAHYQLGELGVVRYRVGQSKILTEQVTQELAALQESGTSAQQKEALEMLSSIDAPAIWASTSMSALHREIRYLDRNNKTLAQQFRNEESVQQYLKPAWEAYNRAELLCPRQARTKFRLAQMSAFFDPALKREADHLRSALSRTHSNTQLHFDCGLLALSSGNQEMAVQLWSKCLSSPHLNAQERVIVELSQAELPMKLLFEQVLPQKPESLLRVARKYFREPRLDLPKRMLLVHTKRVIDKETELSDALRFFYLGEADRLSEQFESAAENYKKALDADSARIAWRFEYAKCLHQIGEFDEAIRQLKICELEPSPIHSYINPLLVRIRRDRANASK